jgi:CRISPR-associated endonuclease Csn1
MRVVKIASSGQFFMCEHMEANVDARNSDKADPFSYDSKYPGSFIKAKGRRVTVSPIGDVRDPGFRS